MSSLLYSDGPGKAGLPTSFQGLAGSSRFPAGGEELGPPPAVHQRPSAAPGGGAGTSRVPRLILLIITLTGAALLVLNISIIACFVRRRAMNRNSTGKTTPVPAINSWFFFLVSFWYLITCRMKNFVYVYVCGCMFCVYVDIYSVCTRVYTWTLYIYTENNGTYFLIIIIIYNIMIYNLFTYVLQIIHSLTF